MNRKAIWTGIASTLAAIATHTYLASTHFQIKFGAGSDHSVCQIGEAFDCSAVAASKYAEFLGVPMAIWGLVANVIALFFAFGYYFSDEKSRSSARKNMLIPAGFIALTSIVMGTISTVMVGKLCLFCIVAYILSFVSFAAYYIAGRDDRKSTSPVSKERFEAKPLIVCAIIALIAGLVINYGWKKAYGAQNMDQIVRSSVNEWAQTAPVALVPVSPIAKGAEVSEAKMTIVEFADFLCPHCKTAGSTLKAFVNARKDVRFIFQTWPLDGECNSKIKVATGLRCGLSRLSFCAGKISSDKGWEAIDWIFERQQGFRDDRSMVEPTVRLAATDLGLSPEETLACVNSEEAKEAVRRQADLGHTLNIDGTPAIFVNGKRLPAGQLLPVLQEAYKRLN